MKLTAVTNLGGNRYNLMFSNGFNMNVDDVDGEVFSLWITWNQETNMCTLHDEEEFSGLPEFLTQEF